MEYHWNKGWDFVIEITTPMSWPSVASGVMTMISHLRIFSRINRFVTNVALSRFVVFLPLALH